MNTYHIYSARLRSYFGNYRASNQAEALESLARDAGYASHEEACRVTKGFLSVEALEINKETGAAE